MEFKKGDYVIVIDLNSKFFKRTGTIVDTSFVKGYGVYFVTFDKKNKDIALSSFRIMIYNKRTELLYV